MTMQNDLFGGTGYRLDFFQMFNWGVFDSCIYTMQCQGESMLLTGSNGTGKTTLVDGLLSLLVPSRYRFYNQSSGAEQKKDRTEESYVRGAYSSKKEEDYSNAVQETLRGKDSYSILLACFTNHGAAAAVTLMQLRYFGGDGQLQQVYSITQKSLTIEEVNTAIGETTGEFDRGGKWRKVLTDQFGTAFYGNSFSKYSNAFSAIFGFRSDKALHLFAQTVGVKVLGNLNEFIRNHMLEEQEMEEEFQKLYKNYSDLLASFNEIEKTQQQLTLLDTILKAGEKWETEKKLQAKLEQFMHSIPVWYAQTGLVLLTKETTHIEQRLASTQDQKASCETRLGQLAGDIDSLKIAIAQNETSRRLTEINFRIESESAVLQRVQETRKLYSQNAQTVDLGVPESEKDFSRNRQLIQEKSEGTTKNLQGLGEELFLQRKGQDKISEEQQVLAQELESLSKRSSNIPLANIEIRRLLCQNLGCSEETLPFAGELLQVAPAEQEWNNAIEKLLHHFALCVLVPEEFYKKVTKYVQATNLKGRLVYYKTREALTLGKKSIPSQQTVPGKMQIKKDHPLASWLADYLDNNFNYLCTDNTDEFSRATRAITSSGLIKADIRHEKDDRAQKSSSPMRVLGWDNTRKKQELSNQYRALETEKERLEEKLQRIRNDQKKAETQLRALENLQTHILWGSIDTKTPTIRLDNLQQEKTALLKNSKDLQQLETRLQELEKQHRQHSIERDSLFSAIGALQQQLETIKIQQESFTQTQNLYAQVEQAIQIAPPPAEFTSCKTIQQLEQQREAIRQKNEKEISTSNGRYQRYNTDLINRMKDFIQPSQDILNTYPSWFSDTKNLGADSTWLPDFIKLHTRLQKDDLPRYKNQFRRYLNERMSDDIINFHTCLTQSEQEIREGIAELNRSLKIIPYSLNPPTHIQLEILSTTDMRIRDFQAMLKTSIIDAGLISRKSQDSEMQNETAAFYKIKALIENLRDNDQWRKKVLDVRNWFTFAAIEYYESDNSQKQYYQDSASLSGGEKAKLAYTILASAIAFQFGISDSENRSRSFRFAIIDEAFSKVDPDNSLYAMELFKHMQLQLMVVTPMDKINIVEEYVSSVHMTENKGTRDSRLISMSIERYQEQKKAYDKGKL